jgi:hypothetical protein
VRLSQQANQSNGWRHSQITSRVAPSTGQENDRPICTMCILSSRICYARFDLVLVLDVLPFASGCRIAEATSRAYRRSTSTWRFSVLGACRGVSIGRSKTLRTSVSSPSTAGPSSWSVSSRLLPVQHFRNITHFPKLLRDANRDHWPCNLFFASKEARNLQARKLATYMSQLVSFRVSQRPRYCKRRAQILKLSNRARAPCRLPPAKLGPEAHNPQYQSVA